MAYRLKRSESIGEGVRRIAREQLEQGIADLTAGKLERHEAVHQVRKRLKKLRGLIRLVRPALGEQYATLNAAYRDAGRELSAVRDAQTMLETLDSLRETYGDQLENSVFETARRGLAERRQRIADEQLDLDQHLRELTEWLGTQRDAAGDWDVGEQSSKHLFDGLAKTYGRARDALDAAADEPTMESLHEWRKRAKYHWYHMRLLRNVWREEIQARVVASDKLSDLLGDDHDLALLCGLLRESDEPFGGDENVQVLVAVANRRRKELQQEAFPLGRRLFAEKTRAFGRRLRTYWQLWRDGV